MVFLVYILYCILYAGYGSVFGPCMRQDHRLQLMYARLNYTRDVTLGCCEIASRNVAGTTTQSECSHLTHGRVCCVKPHSVSLAYDSTCRRNGKCIFCLYYAQCIYPETCKNAKLCQILATQRQENANARCLLRTHLLQM